MMKPQMEDHACLPAPVPTEGGAGRQGRLKPGNPRSEIEIQKFAI